MVVHYDTLVFVCRDGRVGGGEGLCIVQEGNLMDKTSVRSCSIERWACSIRIWALQIVDLSIRNKTVADDSVLKSKNNITVNKVFWNAVCSMYTKAMWIYIWVFAENMEISTMQFSEDQNCFVIYFSQLNFFFFLINCLWTSFGKHKSQGRSFRWSFIYLHLLSLCQPSRLSRIS